MQDPSQSVNKFVVAVKSEEDDTNVVLFTEGWRTSWGRCDELVVVVVIIEEVEGIL